MGGRPPWPPNEHHHHRETCHWYWEWERVEGDNSDKNSRTGDGCKGRASETHSSETGLSQDKDSGGTREEQDSQQSSLPTADGPKTPRAPTTDEREQLMDFSCPLEKYLLYCQGCIFRYSIACNSSMLLSWQFLLLCTCSCYNSNNIGKLKSISHSNAKMQIHIKKRVMLNSYGSCEYS